MAPPRPPARPASWAALSGASRRVRRHPVHSTQEDPIGLAGGLNLYGYAGGDPINFADPFGLYVQIRNATAAAARDRLLAASPTFARLFNALHSADVNSVNLIVRRAVGGNEERTARSTDFGAYAERTAGTADGRIVYLGPEATVGHMMSMLAHEIVHSAGQFSESTGVGAECGKLSGSHQTECFRKLDAQITSELQAYWRANPDKEREDKQAKKPEE